MTFEGALIREQNITFAVVIVKQHIIQSDSTARDAIAAFAPAFPGVPVVLMAQDSRGVPTYYGRRDIAQFMAKVPMHAVPWKRFTLS